MKVNSLPSLHPALLVTFKVTFDSFSRFYFVMFEVSRVFFSSFNLTFNFAYINYLFLMYLAVTL